MSGEGDPALALFMIGLFGLTIYLIWRRSK